jgi:hypothetical protein
MSFLLDHGPHTVKIWVEEEVTDSYGNAVRRPTPDSPVTVTGCIIHPVSSSRGIFPAVDVRVGQRITATWRLLARNAPLGWWARVEFEGRVMTVLGGPMLHTASEASRHISCTLVEER